MSDIPHNEENVAKIRVIAEALRGTAHSLDDRIEEQFGEGITASDLHIELLRELDDIVMECEGCNWWYETGELDDDQRCGDCRPEEDEDD